ncbi:hypothetical protein Tco_0835020 [Tanacetum coccineum]
MDRLARLYLNEIVARHSVPILIIYDNDSRFTSRFWQIMQEALGTRKCRLLIVWAKVGEGHLIRHELVKETTEKILQIKDRLKAARDRQKSYLDKRRKPLEFSVGEHVLLKVSSWKGVVRFRKKEKLAPRFIRPFEIIERIDPVAYRLRLPKELNGVHDTFHVSNLKKCLADPTLHIPLDEIQVDAKLNFVEEPVEILEREFKKLKWSRIAIVKDFTYVDYVLGVSAAGEDCMKYSKSLLLLVIVSAAGEDCMKYSKSLLLLVVKLLLLVLVTTARRVSAVSYNYGSDVLSEVPHSENTHTDMLNQSVQEMSYCEQTHLVNYLENEITSDSNIIPYSQYLLETQNAVVQDINYST